MRPTYPTFTSTFGCRVEYSGLQPFEFARALQRLRETNLDPDGRPTPCLRTDEASLSRWNDPELEQTERPSVMELKRGLRERGYVEWRITRSNTYTGASYPSRDHRGSSCFVPHCWHLTFLPRVSGVTTSGALQRQHLT